MGEDWQELGQRAQARAAVAVPRHRPACSLEVKFYALLWFDGYCVVQAGFKLLSPRPRAEILGSDHYTWPHK